MNSQTTAVLETIDWKQRAEVAEATLGQLRNLKPSIIPYDGGSSDPVFLASDIQQILSPVATPKAAVKWKMPPRILDIKRNESMAPQWAANRYWAAYDYAAKNIKLEDLGTELRGAALFLVSEGILTLHGEGAERIVSIATPATCPVGCQNASGAPCGGCAVAEGGEGV